MALEQWVEQATLICRRRKERKMDTRGAYVAHDARPLASLIGKVTLARSIQQQTDGRPVEIWQAC
jgi:hypothetical protein